MEIVDRTSDPRVKLEAKKAANETLRYIMDLVTGGVVCTEAGYSYARTNKYENIRRENSPTTNTRRDRRRRRPTKDNPQQCLWIVTGKPNSLEPRDRLLQDYFAPLLEF